MFSINSWEEWYDSHQLLDSSCVSSVLKKPRPKDAQEINLFLLDFFLNFSLCSRIQKPALWIAAHRGQEKVMRNVQVKRFCTTCKSNVSSVERVSFINLNKGLFSMFSLRTKTAEQRVEAFILPLFIAEVVVQVLANLHSQLLLPRQCAPFLKLLSYHTMNSLPLRRSKQKSHKILNIKNHTAPIAPVPPNTSAFNPSPCIRN